jgi:hypothetical protein
MMIWLNQLEGICATGVLAAFGCLIIFRGLFNDPLSIKGRKWLDFIGWLILGLIFMIPFVAVLISVWISRMS